MALDSINKTLYSSENGVVSYINTTLQPAEVSIFVNYKEAFYGKKILDIGCGTGRTSHYLRNFTDQYIGVDYSEGMVAFCKHAYPELTFYHADARDLSRFDNESFDLVLFSYNGIDYIEDEGRKKALQEIYRVLKPSGLLVFSAHNRNYKNINTSPRFNLSMNPINFARNVICFLQERNNRARLSKQEVHFDEYAILNDSGNKFGLLTYYITKEQQAEQLEDAGFAVRQMFHSDGSVLKPEQNDSDCCWIYYVCSRI